MDKTERTIAKVTNAGRILSRIAWILADGFYDDTVGLIRNQKKQGFMEV